MAHIVELREMSDEQLHERLEERREELFNLRFQQASARLTDTSRLKIVRREIAKIKEVLRKRELAVQSAAAQPEIAQALGDEKWQGRARYVYESSAWEVEFLDERGNTIATANVDLNQKRREKSEERGQGASQLVKSFEVTG